MTPAGHTASRGGTLVERYRRNYGIPASTPLTAADVARHLERELELTERLLASAPEERREVFDACYSSLYEELPWLNEADATRGVGDWPALIGPPPARVYEVGSGQGGLAVALAARGYDVTASEITLERGGERPAHERLRWGETDGVHLDRYAAAGTYDAVVSNQVVEHLHPDDLPAHLRGALALLRAGGIYALNTPLAWHGPADIGAVFGFDAPVGMHLREYRYGELRDLARAAGFGTVKAAVGLPSRVRHRVGGSMHASAAYCDYVVGVEQALDRLPSFAAKRAAAFLRAPLLPRTLLVVAVKD
jgi:2-polyprenyl-3-methyl-5-hydroxy-6-metoxy-1,4-benzoquinol methylase